MHSPPVLKDWGSLQRPLEATLREKMGKKKGYYLAECNPRWTNYTDAALQVVGFVGKTPSAREIKSLIWDGVHTIDKRDLEGADPEVVRRLLYDLDERAKNKDDRDRVFMRMPGVLKDGKVHAGFILTGNLRKAEKRLELAINRAKSVEVYSRTWHKRNMYNKSTDEK